MHTLRLYRVEHGHGILESKRVGFPTISCAAFLISPLMTGCLTSAKLMTLSITGGESMTTLNIGRLLSFSCAAVLAVALWVLPNDATAGPDIDGAVDALISWPISTFGDVLGSAGLITSSVTGCAGDLVALIDNNKYSGVVLRGLLSKTIHRFSLGVSQTFTGAMEGYRAQDFERYPEAIAAHMEAEAKDMGGRLDSLSAGVGGIYVAITDAVGLPLLVLSRGAGIQGATDHIEGWQKKVRERYLGPVRGGM